MHKIQGPALLGFSDFFSHDEVGAAAKAPAKAPAKPAAKAPAAKGKFTYAAPPRTQTMQQHGKVLKHAHDVVFRAATAVGTSMLALSHKPAAVVTRPLSAKATAVVKALPGRAVHVGEAVAKKMTPKAQAAVAKHNAAVVKAKKAAQTLAQHAIATKKAVKVLAQKMVAQKKTSKLLRTPIKNRATTHVGELLADPVIGEQVAQMLGAYYEAVGAGPDPASPGSLTDGSPDPAVSAMPAAAPDAGVDPGVDMGPLTDEPVDSGMNLPAPPLMDVPIPDLISAGGIIYDGSKGMPDGFAGSYNLFTRATDDYHEPGARGTIDGDAHYGHVYGGFDQDKVRNGIPWGGDMPKQTWNFVHGRHKIFKGDFWSESSLPEAAASFGKMSPNGKVMFGPIVGNPEMADFKAMRVDVKGNMGWLPQEAPDWLTFPIKQAAALTAQAAAKAEAEAKKAEAAAAAKTAADAAAAQAAQEAANALAESASASQEKIAQGAEVTKQAQAETEAQQALVQQQTADTTAQQVETEQTKQAGTILITTAQEQAARDKQVADMLIEQAKQEQTYYAAHPDVMPGSGVPGEDGTESMNAEDEGSSEEMEDAMEDGEQIPGADVMRDEDGEGYQDDEG